MGELAESTKRFGQNLYIVIYPTSFSQFRRGGRRTINVCSGGEMMRAIVVGKIERQILLGVPVLFLAGTLMHFLYGLSGDAFLAGLFAPVNESVWEHLKLVLWPMVLWWTVYYIRMGSEREIDAAAWFAAALSALLTAQVTIMLLFYFYTGAFGVELLAADILIFFLSVLLGQLVGLWIYRQGSGVSWVVPLTLLAMLLALFVILTLAPPALPLFTDPETGTRGIFQL